SITTASKWSSASRQRVDLPEVGRNPLAGVLGNIVQTGVADLRTDVQISGKPEIGAPPQDEVCGL
ncbi:MAG: hypothetical protein WBZ51_40380, partial [Xanthobacteraceae bacterium]